ncbi:MAG: caspase family protein [Paludibaculum sp.]
MAKLTKSGGRSLIVSEDVNGRLLALAVGVSEYRPESGLTRLSPCARDAERVRNALQDVPQLGLANCQLVATGTNEVPTKNTILGSLKVLANSASSFDRLLFFHSGHAVRIAEELYLVPSDAYAPDDPEELVPISKIKSIISGSEARQKLVILDACFSGPDTGAFKTIPLSVSNAFVKRYVKETSGVALLSSSGFDQKSTAKSPDNKLSLFTYFLVRALEGDPEALDDNRHLTLFSLHSYLSASVSRRARDYGLQQRPGLDVAVNGDFLLGDFSGSLIDVESVRLDEHPIRALEFADDDRINVRTILTKMKSGGRFTPDQLQYAANTALPEHLEAELGGEGGYTGEKVKASAFRDQRGRSGHNFSRRYLYRFLRSTRSVQRISQSRGNV